MNILMAAEITGKISTLTIASMTISAVLLVIFPVFCIIFFRNRLKADGREVIFGALAYLVIALILVNVLSMLVMMIPGARELLLSNVPLLVIYNMVITILPEVGALAFFLRNRFKKKQNLACYMEFAAGYIAVELIMVAFTVTLTNLMIAGTYNSGGIEALREMTEAGAEADFSYVSEIMEMPFYVYLLSGVEGCLFAAIRVCFIVLMYMIYQKGLPAYYYAIIIGLYALVKVPSALSDLGVLADTLVDPLLVVVCIGELIYLFRVIKKGIPEEIAPLLRKPEISFKRKKAEPRSTDQGFH